MEIIVLILTVCPRLLITGRLYRVKRFQIVLVLKAQRKHSVVKILFIKTSFKSTKCARSQYQYFNNIKYCFNLPKNLLREPSCFSRSLFWYNEEFETVLREKVFKLNEFSMR